MPTHKDGKTSDKTQKNDAVSKFVNGSSAPATETDSGSAPGLTTDALSFDSEGSSLLSWFAGQYGGASGMVLPSEEESEDTIVPPVDDTVTEVDEPVEEPVEVEEGDDAPPEAPPAPPAPPVAPPAPPAPPSAPTPPPAAPAAPPAAPTPPQTAPAQDTTGPVDDASAPAAQRQYDTIVNDPGGNTRARAGEETDDQRAARIASQTANHKAVEESINAILKDKRKVGLITLKDGKFGDVKAILSRLILALNESVPEDPTAFKNLSKAVINSYTYSINECKAYLSYITEKDGGHSKDGSRRISLVSDLIPLLERESVVIDALVSSYNKSSMSGKRFGELLYDIRSERLDVNAPDIEKKGAGTSVLYHRTPAGGKSDFVKQEEKTLLDEKEQTMVSAFLDSGGANNLFFVNAWDYVQSHAKDEPLFQQFKTIEEMIRAIAKPTLGDFSKAPQEPGQSDDDYRQKWHRRLNLCLDVHFGKFPPAYSPIIENTRNTPALLEAYGEYRIQIGKKYTERQVSLDAGINAGSTISDRNVSSSIVAGKIGMSDIVAGSSTILLDKGNGQVVRANSMEEVEGKSLPDIEKQATEEETQYAKDHPGKKIKITINYTPQAVMQIFMLNIFDLITGQVDRNPGNILFTVDKQAGENDSETRIWYLTSMKAIDNDMSFGKLEGKQFEEGYGARTLKGLFTENSRTAFKGIHYLPRSFYESVMSYNPDMAVYDQLHLRSPEELKALRSRITYVQKELERLCNLDMDSDEGKEFGIRLIDSDDATQLNAAFNETIAEKYRFFSEKENGVRRSHTGKNAFIRINGTNLLDWKHMRRQDKTEETEWDELTPETEEEEYISSPQTSQTPNTETHEETEEEAAARIVSQTEAHNAMLTIANAIIDDKRKIGLISLKDGRFGDVKAIISRLILAIGESIPEEPAAFDVTSKAVKSAYSNSIKECSDYITYIEENKKGRSIGGGKARLELVKTLLPMLKHESGLMEALTSKYDKDSMTGKKYSDLLYDVRAQRVGSNDSNVEMIGSGTSIIYKRKNDDGTVEYIKEEERSASEDSSQTFLDMYINAGGADSLFFNKAWEFAQRDRSMKGKFKTKDDLVRELGNPQESDFAKLIKRPGETDAQFKKRWLVALSTVIHFEGKYPRLANYMKKKENADMLESYGEFRLFVGKKHTEFMTAQTAKIRPGSTISDRNVSSSILANRIGMNDIVAESTSILIDKGDGNTARANSMAEAEGKALWLWEAEAVYEEEQYAKTHPGKKIHISINYTPQAVMQLYMINIFDLISGQIDRNPSNFLFTVQKQTSESDPENPIWYLTSVKAIDNDMSFGRLKLGKGNNGLIGTLKLFLDEEDAGQNDTNSIRFLPRSFYERVMSYSPDMAVFDQAHLRTGEELNALRQRIEYVQKELKRRCDPKNYTPEQFKKFGIVLIDSDEQTVAEYNKAVDTKHLYFGQTDENGNKIHKYDINEVNRYGALEDGSTLSWRHMRYKGENKIALDSN